MEHLFSNPSRPAKFEIQYRECNRVRPYSGETSQGYFERYSYTADRIVADYSHPLPDGKHEFFLCLLQNYCFFAFLRECLHIFNISFNRSDFIRQDKDGQKWLSTSSLPAYAHQICLARAHNVIAGLDKNPTTMGVETVQDLPDPLLAQIGASDPDLKAAEIQLQQIWGLCNAEDRFLERLQASLTRRRVFILFDDQDFQLMITCATLTEAMWSFIRKLFPNKTRQAPGTFHVNQSVIDILVRLHKWCPNRVANLSLGPSLTTLLITTNLQDERRHGPDISQILSRLKRNGRDNVSARQQLYRLYSELRTGEDESCTDQKCFKSFQASENMEPSHRYSGAGSGCMAPPIDQPDLSNTYLNGTFPVLAFDPGPRWSIILRT